METELRHRELVEAEGPWQRGLVRGRGSGAEWVGSDTVVTDCGLCIIKLT